MVKHITNEEMESILYPRRFMSMEEVKHYTSGDRVTCLICDKSFMNLARHITVYHGCDPKKYRDILNIPRTTNLMCIDYLNRMTAKSKDNFYNKLSPEQREFILKTVHNPKGFAGEIISTISIEGKIRGAQAKGKNKGKKHGRANGKCYGCGKSIEISTQRVNRITKCHACLEKSHAESTAKWRRSNKEKVSQYQKQWYQSKKQKLTSTIN